MKTPLVTRPYFSTNPARERLAFRLCWGTTIIFSFILIAFWAKTRDLGFILYLQQFRSTPVEIIFRFFTFLGDDEFYMIFFGVLIWCVSKPLGFWAGVVLLLSGTYRGAIKEMTYLERPNLPGVVQPPDTAFPSGHAVMAVNVWGYIAVHMKKRGYWVWAGVAVVMVSFSRLILGVHFLGDILAGIAFGIPFLLLILWVSVTFTEQGWDKKFSLPQLLTLSLVLPVIFTVVVPGHDISKLMGYMAGAGFGYTLEKEKVRSVVTAPLFTQTIKSVLGLAVLFGIIMGLSPLLPSSVTFLGFIRYALGGLWVTLLAPLVFVKLKLSKTA